MLSSGLEPLVPSQDYREQEGEEREKNEEALLPSKRRMWGVLLVLEVALLFLLAGLAEIGGGWMVWKSVREAKPWWWAVCGSLILVLYGFVPTLQPLNDFGRLYAVYGCIFIGLSFAWGYYFDGMQIDKGDIIGSALALAGGCTALFWPRGDS